VYCLGVRVVCMLICLLGVSIFFFSSRFCVVEVIDFLIVLGLVWCLIRVLWFLVSLVCVGLFWCRLMIVLFVLFLCV